MSTGPLGTRQAALVAALVAGAPPPAGFDVAALVVTQRALLRKRAGEVAYAWPLLAAAVGSRWPGTFVRWAGKRPPVGALRDGWDLARELAARGELPELGRQELAEHDVRWRYDGRRAPSRRRLPMVRRVPGGVIVQLGGRVRRLAGEPGSAAATRFGRQPGRGLR